MTAEHVLKLRSFGVTFGEKTVLANLTFDVPAIGTVCFVGAGRSTLLRISTLIPPEAFRSVDNALAERFGMTSIHCPIVDLGVPTIESTPLLCEQTDRLMVDGAVIGVHCRAGVGRTGTVLATQLVFTGESDGSAIERIGRMNPNFIQSPVQVEFLSSHEAYCRVRRRSDSARQSLPDSIKSRPTAPTAAFRR